MKTDKNERFAPVLFLLVPLVLDWILSPLEIFEKAAGVNITWKYFGLGLSLIRADRLVEGRNGHSRLPSGSCDGSAGHR